MAFRAGAHLETNLTDAFTSTEPFGSALGSVVPMLEGPFHVRPTVSDFLKAAERRSHFSSFPGYDDAAWTLLKSELDAAFVQLRAGEKHTPSPPWSNLSKAFACFHPESEAVRAMVKVAEAIRPEKPETLMINDICRLSVQQVEALLADDDRAGGTAHWSSHLSKGASALNAGLEQLGYSLGCAVVSERSSTPEPISLNFAPAW